LIAKPFLELPS